MSFQSFLQTLDENAFILLANKGIYKRAQKELAKMDAPEISEGDGKVAVKWDDATECVFTDDIEASICTCPSRTFCKHRMMALLYLKEHWLEEGNAEETNGEELVQVDFSEVLALGKKRLKEEANIKDLKLLSMRYAFGVRAEIVPQAMLQISFPAENITCAFPAQEPWKNSLCSCKAKGTCYHRLEALAHYLIDQGEMNPDELIEGSDYDLPFPLLADVMAFCTEILGMGLARLPESLPPRAGQLAVACHSADLPNLEKKLRGVETSLGDYLKQKVTVTPQGIQGQLQRLYLTAKALVHGKGDLPQLVGEHKSPYVPLASLRLAGLGAEAWLANSGYQGITYYFVDQRTKKWFSYTQASPTMYAEKLNFRPFHQIAPWGLNVEARMLTHSVIDLKSPKVSRERRLSSSQETEALIYQSTDVSGLSHEFGFTNWSALRKAVQSSLLPSLTPEESMPVILRPKGWGTPNFDAVEQVFTQPIFDERDDYIDIKIRYSEATKRLIDALEKMNKNKAFPEAIMGRVFHDGTEAVFFPFTGLYGSGLVRNWTIRERVE